MALTPSQYILDLYKPEDRIAVFFISRTDEGRVKQRIMNAGDAASDKWQGYFRFMNAPQKDPAKPKEGRPWDIYISMNPLHPHATGRHKEDVAEIRHVFMEIDDNGPAALAKVLSHPALAEPNYVLTSSPGKFQIVWKVNDFTLEKAETLCRNMVQEFAADPARIDVSSILRLPGFRNQKYPDIYHKVTVESRSKDVVGPEAFPRELFAQERAYERVKQPGRSNGHQKSGVDQSRKDGRYACEALRRGRDREEVAEEIDRYRLADGKTKYRDDYGRATVEWAMRQPDVIAARARLQERNL